MTAHDVHLPTPVDRSQQRVINQRNGVALSTLHRDQRVRME